MRSSASADRPRDATCQLESFHIKAWHAIDVERCWFNFATSHTELLMRVLNCCLLLIHRQRWNSRWAAIETITDCLP